MSNDTGSEFHLGALVRQVMDETDIADPHELAAKVAEMVPARLRLEALRQALPTFVRVRVTQDRGSHTVSPSARGSGNTNSGRSSKVAAIRAAAPAWKKALRERLNVGDRVWRFLGECTIENLRFAAVQRRQMALHNSEAAGRYDRIADALETHSVETVQQLPEPVLAELFPSGDGEAAA